MVHHPAVLPEPPGARLRPVGRRHLRPDQQRHRLGRFSPAPAPAPSGATYNTPLSVFNGANPNGTWNLYIRDDAAIDTGSISGGVADHHHHDLGR